VCDVTHPAVPCVTWLILRCDESHSVMGSMCDVTHSEVLHHIHTCDTTHSYEWHDSFTCVAWLVHMCDMTHSHAWYDAFAAINEWVVKVMPEAWLICGYKWHVRHDSFTCATWLIVNDMCDRTHSHVWHDSFISRTHSHAWHDSFISWLVTRCCWWAVWFPFRCVTWLIHMCDMTLSHVWQRCG